MQRRIYGRATDVEIRPLDEEKAVQAAADLLGELFVFTVPSILESYFSHMRQGLTTLNMIAKLKYVHGIKFEYAICHA